MVHSVHAREKEARPSFNFRNVLCAGSQLIFRREIMDYVHQMLIIQTMPKTVVNNKHTNTGAWRT